MRSDQVEKMVARLEEILKVGASLAQNSSASCLLV